MVQINQGEFASKIVEFHRNPDRFGDKAKEIADTLVELYEEDPYHHQAMKGIRFRHNTKLAMILLDRAYNGLSRKVPIETYAKAIAQTMQDFATPFPEKENLAYPHFLLHGIEEPTLERVVRKIKNNGRIIHETLRVREQFKNKYKQKELDGLILDFDYGLADDYFGITCFLASKEEKFPSGSYGYIAKGSFFLDKTNREIYVITVQGQKVRHKVDQNNKTIKDKERSGEYARLAAKLGLDPRAFVLTQICELGKKENFQRIKVIKPEYHPMFIEKHEGFMGRYGPIIIQAGINEENGCYLERDLRK